MKDKIKLVMECSDFERIKKVMDFLEWEWAGTDGVPTIYEIIKYAEGLLGQVCEQRGGYGLVSCGGFTAVRDGEDLELRFCLSEANTYN